MKSSLFRALIAIVSLGLLAGGCAMPEAVNIKPIPHAIKPQSSTSAQASQSAGPSTGKDQGAQPKAAAGPDLAKIDLAKTKVAANPASWSAYNDLGVAYYDQGMYDEAIAAFQQALAVHPISSVMDAEKRQRDAAQRQKQAMLRAREAQAAAQQSAVMGSLLSGLLGVAPIPGMSSVGQQALQAMIPAIEGVSRAASMPNSSMADFPELSNPSQLKPRRETALIYSNLGRAYYQKKQLPGGGHLFREVHRPGPLPGQAAGVAGPRPVRALALRALHRGLEPLHDPEPPVFSGGQLHPAVQELHRPGNALRVGTGLPPGRGGL